MNSISLIIIAPIFGGGIFFYSISILQISKALKHRDANVKVDKEGSEARFFKYWTLISLFVVALAIYLLPPITLDSITKVLFWLAIIILVSSIPVLVFSTYLVKLYPANTRNS